MCEAAVKEHVGEQLLHLKVGSNEKMEPEQGVSTLFHEHRHEVAHHVDDEQISCYCRYVSHLFLFSCYPSNAASFLSISLENKAVDGAKLRKISRKELKKRV